MYLPPCLLCILLVLYYGIKYQLGKINWLLGLIVLGIWFSAVYSSHHYILDVLAGITCSILGIWLFQQMIKGNTWVHRAINRAVKALS
jgi:membrane-associated phospholipid phosphatase